VEERVPIIAIKRPEEQRSSLITSLAERKKHTRFINQKQGKSKLQRRVGTDRRARVPGTFASIGGVWNSSSTT
jgi:hypothetical protein